MRRAALVIGKPAVGVRDCLVDGFCIVLAFDEWRENFCTVGRRNILHTGHFSRSFWNFLRKVWARAQKRGIIENARGGLYAQSREKPKEETVQDKRFALNSPLRKTLAGVCAVLVFCGICYAAYNLTFWLRNRRIVNTYGPGGSKAPVVQAITLEDYRPGHAITFYGKDGDSIYVEQTRTVSLFSGGVARLEIADSDWFDYDPNQVEGANMGVVPPKKGFLEGLRKLCDEYGALLIFDEVITGFRLAFGGAAEYFGVTPDLVTYGKIIGAGMPVGAYGGRREIMELVSPVGKVYQAGTLSGNPIAMAAGLTQLKYLYEHQEIYKDLEEKGKRLYGGMEKILAEKNLPYHINHVSSLGSLFFTEQEVVDYTSAKSSDTKAFSEYFKGMLAQGIHMAPSQFEAMFLSVAHTDEIIDQTLEAVRNYFTK